jgi:outer membrane receptor for ferrienterochelin and colicins
MRVIAILGILFIFTTVVIAQEQKQEEVTLEDIFNLVSEGKVITATRTERLLKTAPQAVTVITRQQIKEMGASTIGEALRFVPGMNARITPMGGVLGIRSLGPSPFTERVLLLIDGTPYNSPDKGGLPGHPAYEDFFPIEHVKRIEVIKGPGSALYGQNAFFGIVNIITEDFKDKGSRSVVAQGGSRNVGRFALSYGDTGEDWNYSFTGKYKTQDGPMRFNDNSDINSGDFFAKGNYKDFAISYLFHKDDSSPFIFDRQLQIATHPTHQTLNFVDASYNKKFSEQLSWRTKGFFNRRNGNTCENCHNPLSVGHQDRLVENEDEVNQRLYFNSQLDWVVASHRIIFGIDGQSDKTEKNIVRLADADETVNNVAGYAQGEFSFANGKTIITAGLRVDQNEITDTSVSPSISGVFLPTEKLVLRTSYGRAFRQPTWNDLFIDLKFLPSPGPPPLRITGNPNLQTEKIDTFEAGLEYFFTPELSAKTDFYYSSIRDFIQFGPGVPIGLSANRGPDIHVSGVDIEGRFRPSHKFSAILGYAFQSTDLNSPTSAFDPDGAYAPDNKFTGIINVNPIDLLSFNFGFNYWSKFDSRRFPAESINFFGEEVGKPFTYANFQTVVRLPVGGEHLNLGFLIKNVFDEEVQLTPAVGVDDSLFGREYYGTVSFDF